MRAIVVDQTGGPEVLKLRDVPTPSAGPGELLVDVAAAGVNFIDIYVRTGAYPSALPIRPGKEGSGVVSEVGDGAGGFTAGDRVAWAMGASGAYAEKAVVPASLAVRVPDDIDAHVAAAAMLQGMTAHFLSESIVPLKAGDTALVHAGAGGVGLLLTQLLVRNGVRVLSTTSTQEKADLSRGAGASDVIDYTVQQIAPAVRDLTGGEGVAAVFDGVGAATFEASLDSLRARGTLILFGAASGPVAAFDPQILNGKGSLMLTRPSLAHFIANRAELEWRANDVFDGIRGGSLNVRIGRTYDLADAGVAHDDLAARRSTGKLLLIP